MLLADKNCKKLTIAHARLTLDVDRNCVQEDNYS